MEGGLKTEKEKEANRSEQCPSNHSTLVLSINPAAVLHSVLPIIHSDPVKSSEKPIENAGFADVIPLHDITFTILSLVRRLSNQISWKLGLSQ